MKPLVRATPKPAPPRTKVLLVRSAGARSVRRIEEPDRTALRLAVGVIAVLGVVGAVWLIGLLGFHLGFAPLIDVPQLRLAPGAALSTGVVMLVSTPRMIFLLGRSEPLWLMLAFALVMLPAASLGAARPRVAGGPRPPLAAQAFSYAGAVAAALNAALLLWWTASPYRTGRIDQLRIDPRETTWLEDLTTVAGLDVLAVVVAALWVVLVLRLAIPLWLRALSATAALFALVVVTVAMSMSNGAAAQLRRPRSEVFFDDGSVDTRLVLGSTDSHVVTMRTDQGVAVIELHDEPGKLTVVGRQSIIDMLQRAASRQR